MEKEHLYRNRDNLVSSRGELLNQTPLAKLLLSRKAPTVTVVKPEIKPTPTVTLTKPTTANTPLILAPNISGGLKVAAPSPVNVTAAKTVELKSTAPVVSAVPIAKVTTAPIPVVKTTAPITTTSTKIAIPGMAPISKTGFQEQVKAGAITKIDPAKVGIVETQENKALQAGGFKLPNIWLMLGMLAAVVVMYFIAKRKKT